MSTDLDTTLRVDVAVDVFGELCHQISGRRFILECARSTVSGTDYGLMSSDEVKLNNLARSVNETHTGMWQVPAELVSGDALLVVDATVTEVRVRFVNGTDDETTMPL